MGTAYSQRGFTLIEMIVAVTVAVVLLSVAVPSFSSMIARGQLKSAAERLRADLVLARAEASRRNAPISLTFRLADDGSWCYGLNLDNACDCTAASGPDVCALDQDADGNPVRRVVTSSEYRGVAVDQIPFRSGSIRFTPVRPTLRPGSARLSASGMKARVIASAFGRIRLCSPSDAKPVFSETC